MYLRIEGILLLMNIHHGNVVGQGFGMLLFQMFELYTQQYEM